MATWPYFRTRTTDSKRSRHTGVRRCLGQVQSRQTESRHCSTEVTERSNRRRSNFATGESPIRLVHLRRQQTAATGGGTVQPTPIYDTSPICTTVRCRGGTTKSANCDASHQTDAAAPIQRAAIVQCTETNLHASLDSAAKWTELRKQLTKRHPFPRRRIHAIKVSWCLPRHSPW